MPDREEKKPNVMYVQRGWKRVVELESFFVYIHTHNTIKLSARTDYCCHSSIVCHIAGGGGQQGRQEQRNLRQMPHTLVPRYIVRRGRKI